MTNGKKRVVTAAVIVVGVGLLLLAGGLVAGSGNMGFKLTVAMDAQGAISPALNSNSGTNYVGLPYRPRFDLTNAQSLWFAIIAAEPNSSPTINRHNKATDGFFFYAFGSDATNSLSNFALQPGEAYSIKVTEDAPLPVIGAHVPDTIVTLYKQGEGSFPPIGNPSASGTNYFAPPYNAVAATAQELWFEIGQDGAIINRHNQVTDGFFFYAFGSDPNDTCVPFSQPGCNNFPIVPGEGYSVKVTSTLNYQPLHY